MKNIIIKTYLLTIFLIASFYLIPSYLMINQMWPEELMVMQSPPNFQSALNYIWILFISYTLVVLIGLNILKNPTIYKTNNKKINTLISEKVQIILLLISYILIAISVDLEDLLFAKSRFFSEHAKLLNISSAILLFLFCLNLFTINKKNINIFILILSLIGFIVYPIAHSSRACAIPLVITTLYYFYIKNSYIKSFIFFYLSAVFLGSALYTRDDLGFYNYIVNLIFLFFNPIIIFEKILHIIPGLGTTSLAIQMFSENWQFDGGISNFILYFSPVPSTFLPEKFWELGYSVYLNVTYMGLNTDYISEWIWWFGYWGCLIGGILTGLITLTPLIIGYKLKLSEFSVIIICITGLYFIMAGTSMSLRSSSRFFFYVITVIIIFDIIKRNLIINEKSNNL